MYFCSSMTNSSEIGRLPCSQAGFSALQSYGATPIALEEDVDFGKYSASDVDYLVFPPSFATSNQPYSPPSSPTGSLPSPVKLSVKAVTISPRSNMAQSSQIGPSRSPLEDRSNSVLADLCQQMDSCCKQPPYTFQEQTSQGKTKRRASLKAPCHRLSKPQPEPAPISPSNGMGPTPEVSHSLQQSGEDCQQIHVPVGQHKDDIQCIGAMHIMSGATLAGGSFSFPATQRVLQIPLQGQNMQGTQTVLENILDETAAVQEENCRASHAQGLNFEASAGPFASATLMDDQDVVKIFKEMVTAVVQQADQREVITTRPADAAIDSVHENRAFLGPARCPDILTGCSSAPLSSACAPAFEAISPLRGAKRIKLLTQEETLRSPGTEPPGLLRSMLQQKQLPKDGCFDTLIAGRTSLFEHVQGTAQMVDAAEQQLRLQCLRASQSSPTLNQETETADITQQSSWLLTGVSAHYGSLVGEDAAAQADVAAFARAFLDGDPIGSLKNVVSSEAVLGTGKLLLGADHRKLQGYVTDRWQWVVWREFRRLGMDVFCFEIGNRHDKWLDQQDSISACDDKEVEGYLCMAGEVLQRQEEFRVNGWLVPLQPTTCPTMQHSQPAGLSSEGGPQQGPAGSLDEIVQGSPGKSCCNILSMLSAQQSEQDDEMMSGVSLELEASLRDMAVPQHHMQPCMEAARQSENDQGPHAMLTPQPQHQHMGEGGEREFPPSAPNLRHQDWRGGISQLEIPSTQMSPRNQQSPRATCAWTSLDGASQLDIPLTYTSVQHRSRDVRTGKEHGASDQQWALSRIVQKDEGTCNRPCAAAVMKELSVVTSKLEGEDDPFDDILAMNSQPDGLNKKGLSQEPGSWWFCKAKEEARGDGRRRCTGTVCAAAASPASDNNPCAASTSSTPGQQSTDRDAMRHSRMQQSGQEQATGDGGEALCTMVPDTSPESPATGPDSPARISPKSQPIETAAVVPCSSEGKVGHQAPGTAPSPSCPAVPDSEDVAQEQACEPQQGLPSSQVVDEGELSHAMQRVGRISDDFPATQDMLPECQGAQHAERTAAASALKRLQQGSSSRKGTMSRKHLRKSVGVQRLGLAGLWRPDLGAGLALRKQQLQSLATEQSPSVAGGSLQAPSLPSAVPSSCRLDGINFTTERRHDQGWQGTWAGKPRGEGKDQEGRRKQQLHADGSDNSFRFQSNAHDQAASQQVALQPRQVSLAKLHATAPDAQQRCTQTQATNEPAQPLYCQDLGCLQHMPAQAPQLRHPDLESGDDGHQLLVVQGPHPLIQTMPSGGGELSAPALQQLETAQQQQQQQDGDPRRRPSSRPARHARLPARFRTMADGTPATSAGPRPVPGDQGPKATRGAIGTCGGQGSRQGLGSADGPPSRKRTRCRSPGLSGGWAGDHRGAAPAATVPESEDQLLAERFCTCKLGCSKCRYSEGGCRKCRGEREAHIKSLLQGMPCAPAAAPTPSRRRSLPGAAAAAGALLSASPSPARIRRQPLQTQRCQAAGSVGAHCGMAKEKEELASQEMPPTSRKTKCLQGQAGRRSKLDQEVAGGSAPGSTPGVGGRIFQGSVFLVTGFTRQLDQKRWLVDRVREQGGEVIDQIPPPPGNPEQQARKRGGSVDCSSCEGRLVTAVLCDTRLRTPKFLYACITGIPLLGASWVEACLDAGKQVPPIAEHLVWSSRPVESTGRCKHVFAGLRVFLHGDHRVVHSFGQLLEHAGATIVPSIDLQAHPAGGSSRQAEREPNCDLMLIDGDDAPEAKVMESLRRLARRLYIPVHNRSWAIDALLKGRLPDDFPPVRQQRQQDEETRTPTLLGKRSRGILSPAAQQHLPAQEGGGGGGGAARVRRRLSVCGGGGRKPGVPPQGEASEGEAGSPGRPQCRRSPRQAAAQAEEREGGPVKGGPRRRGRPRKKAMSPSPPARQQQPGGEAVPAGQAAPSAARAQPAPSTDNQTPAARLAVADISWVGQPQPAPAGLPENPFRQYFYGFRKGTEEVQLGDCVELAPAPGEEATRLAQVQALWSERAAGGQERMLAQCRRYYRPEEMEKDYTDIAAPQELFLVDHVEQRVALAAVMRKCSLVPQVPQDSPGPHTYVCRFYVDSVGRLDRVH